MQVNSKEYQEHEIFHELTIYAKFYDSLSLSTMHWITPDVSSLLNKDNYIFSSLQGTLESTFDVLKRGRINDGYALLHKYYDSSIINIYSNLYLSDHFSIDNFVVEKIEKWRWGTESISGFGNMSEYILASDKVKEITQLLYQNGGLKNSPFEGIRRRCNEHTQYLYYNTFAP
ncbi:hypothetical protein [Sphingobacterium sp. HSC-15S19]|uniref:hypothetical protein n=1 Tax=Sphingobacterium TaxID=28453 RepID=UPI003D19A702